MLESLVSRHQFSSRAGLVTALPGLADGTVISINGIHAIVDSTATGDASALHDLSTDGVRLLGPVVPIQWWTYGLADGADATALIQAAIDYAIDQGGAFGQADAGPVVLEGGFEHLSISNQLVFTTAAQKITFQNVGLRAIDSGATNWITSSTDHTTVGNNAMIKLENVKLPVLNNIILDGNELANGIHITGAGGPNINDCYIYRYKQFGVCMYAGFQLRMNRCLVEQWRGADVEYTNQSAMTGYGLWTIGKGDMEIRGCIVSKNLYNIYIQGGANYRIYDNHLFNGSSDGSVQWDNPVNINIVAGSNSHDIFIRGNYIDNGKIQITGAATENMLIDHNEFLNDGARAVLDEWVRLIPSSAGQDLDFMRFGGGGNTYHFTAGGSAAEPNIMTLGTTGGTWDANTLINSQFNDMRFVSQANGQAVVQIKPSVSTVEAFVTNTTGAFNRYVDATTDYSGRLAPQSGAVGDDYVIRTNGVSRVTVSDTGIVATNLTDVAAFTPTLTFGGGSTGLTYTTQTGRSRRVGPNVFVDLEIVIGAVGSSTGNAVIGGLSIAAGANALGVSSNLVLAGTTTGNQSFAQIVPGSNTISLYNDRHTTGVVGAITEGMFQAGSRIRLSITYEAS